MAFYKCGEHEEIIAVQRKNQNNFFNSPVKFGKLKSTVTSTQKICRCNLSLYLIHFLHFI